MINPRLQVVGKPFSGCSAFVKVDQEGATEAFGSRPVTGAAWRIAEQVVQWATLQAIERNSPPEGESDGSSLLLDGLADGLYPRDAASRKVRAHTWLV